MGILANDGDHPSLFGDYRGGNIVEQVLFATKPAGKDSPFAVVLGGNLVYHDWQARLYRGDIAFQGVLAGVLRQGAEPDRRLRDDPTARTPTRRRGSTRATRTTSSRRAVDVAGHFATPVPGNPSTYLYGAGELAFILGSTNELRTADQALTGQSDDDRVVRRRGVARRRPRRTAKARPSRRR